MIEVERVGKRYGTFEAVHDVSFSVGGSRNRRFARAERCRQNNDHEDTDLFSFPVIRFGFGKRFRRLPGRAFDKTVDRISSRKCSGLQRISRCSNTWTLSPRCGIRDPAAPGGESARIRRERLDWAILECGLGSVANRSISKLSKGFRQRTGLAQAILHDPAILILDEPTSGLDPNQIIEIRRLIRKLGREKTVILSTHILQEVEAVCDRVLILNEGKIVAEGTTEEIGRGNEG